MENVKGVRGSCSESEEDAMDLRRGPWTVEEDFTLINYIALHGEGHWNSLARCAGLKRTGKSCRLRWLNYLRPDVRRGNITLAEQLLILQLHCRWGNRWSKIAQHLPGRTDNEIKNYWRTRVQKHAKQLKCDVNSKQFKDTVRYLWIPRLMERIQAAGGVAGGVSSTNAATTVNSCTTNYILDTSNMDRLGLGQEMLLAPPNMARTKVSGSSCKPENSGSPASSDSFGTQISPVVSDLTDGYNCPVNHHGNNQDYHHHHQPNQLYYGESLTSPTAHLNHGGLDFQPMDNQNNQWLNAAQVCDNLWNVEDMWFLHHQLNTNV